MKTEEKYSRITITLPPDLARWVRKKEADLNARDRRMKTSVSAIISDAVEEMKKREEADRPVYDANLLHEDFSQAQPHSGPVIVKPHKASAGGSKTREIRYQAKGRGRS